MNLNLKNAVLLVSLSIFFSSCNEPSIQSSNEVDKEQTELFDFNGEKVIIPSDFPKELFGQTQKQLESHYNNLLNRSNARTGSKTTINYEQVASVIAKHNSKYPTINSNMELSDESFHRIIKDIPTIKTKEEALKKIDIVYEYYDTRLKNDILPEIIQMELSSSVNARTNGISPGSLTDA